MHPFINIGGKLFPSYSLMCIVGFAAAFIFIFLRCKALNLSADSAIYIFVLSSVSGLLGAKFFYLLTVFPEFITDFRYLAENPEYFLEKYISGGLVFYGGLIFGVVTAFILSRSYRVKLTDYFPALLPSLALVSGFGRIGCFMVGCCYGIESSLPITVTFPAGAIAPAGLPLLPVQLFEAGFDFILFFLMIFICSNAILKRWAARIYIVLYAVVRFFLEFIRGDAVRGFWLSLSTSQWISILLLIIVLLISIAEMKMKNRISSVE